MPKTSLTEWKNKKVNSQPYAKRMYRTKGFCYRDEYEIYTKCLDENDYEKAIMLVLIRLGTLEVIHHFKQQRPRLVCSLKEAFQMRYNYLVKMGKQNVDPISFSSVLPDDIKSIIQAENDRIRSNIINVDSPESSTSPHTSLDNLQPDSQSYGIQDCVHYSDIDIESTAMHETSNNSYNFIPQTSNTACSNFNNIDEELPEPISENVEDLLDLLDCVDPLNSNTMFVPKARGLRRDILFSNCTFLFQSICG